MQSPLLGREDPCMTQAQVAARTMFAQLLADALTKGEADLAAGRITEREWAAVRYVATALKLHAEDLASIEAEVAEL